MATKVVKTLKFPNSTDEYQINAVVFDGKYPRDFARHTEGIHMIENCAGTTDTTNKVSTWTGTSNCIIEYTDGLKISYKIPEVGNTTTTLNINNLGAKTIYRFGTTKLTTQFAVNQIITLIYCADLNGGCWVTNDYDADSDTKVRQYNRTNSSYNKQYSLLARADTASVTSNSYDADYALFSTKATINPYSGEITTPKVHGDLDGTATRVLSDLTVGSKKYNGSTPIEILPSDLGLSQALKFVGTTTTALTDGATTSPIKINSANHTPATGDVVIVSGTDQEFVWTGAAWEELGNASSHSKIGHTHNVTHKPAGTVSQPTFSGTGTLIKGTFNGTEQTASVSYTPAGSVSTPTITVTPNTTTVNSITAVGTLPSLTKTDYAVDDITAWSAGSGSFTATISSTSATTPNKVVTLAHGHTAPSLSYTARTVTQITDWSAGTLPTKGSNTTVVTGIKSAKATQPTFTGTAATISHKHTPSGTITITTGAPGTGETANYTPAGTVSKPTFSGTSATLTTSAANS